MCGSLETIVQTVLIFLWEKPQREWGGHILCTFNEQP